MGATSCICLFLALLVAASAVKHGDDGEKQTHFDDSCISLGTGMKLTEHLITRSYVDPALVPLGEDGPKQTHFDDISLGMKSMGLDHAFICRPRCL